jgi:hypothetical protein
MLVGHTNVETMVRHLGVEVGNALNSSRGADI